MSKYQWQVKLKEDGAWDTLAGLYAIWSQSNASAQVLVDQYEHKSGFGVSEIVLTRNREVVKTRKVIDSKVQRGCLDLMREIAKEAGTWNGN